MTTAPNETSPLSGAARTVAGAEAAASRRLSRVPFSDWTPEQDAQLRALWKLRPGISIRAIGERMGVGKNAALARGARLGLPKTAGLPQFAAHTAQQKAARAERAAELRALVDGGLTVRKAGEHLGMGRGVAGAMAAEFGIKISAERRSAIRKASMQKCLAARGAPPNPRLSPLQQQAVEQVKVRWRSTIPRLPPIAEDEAARLIAEAIAAGRVTRCPPAVSPLTPHNGGVGFR